jgi:hypothetical protein
LDGRHLGLRFTDDSPDFTTAVFWYGYPHGAAFGVGMRDDVAIAIGVFLLILAVLVILVYFGWDRWNPLTIS